MDSKTTRYESYIGTMGHALFALLTVMAAWFWQERTLILDAAFQSYLFIADGYPAIMVERFGAATVQLLPLAGVWAGVSLSAVLLLYSVSIVLFHWALFGVCLHVLKDKKAAFAILLFNILLVGDSFYWMQNELLQAITLMFVLWSLWMRRGDRNRFNRLDWWLGIVLSTTVIYYHPLVFFPLAFVWCWLWLHQDRLLSRQTLLLVAALFALIFSSKYILRQPNFYDRGMTGQYVREFNFSLKKLIASNSFRDFAAHLDDNFLLLLPLLALVTGYYILQKRWLLAALVPGATLLYCLLIMQRFLADDRWYIQESHYQALAVFLIVPLVWDVLPEWLARLRHSRFSKPGMSVFLLLSILLIIRLTGIWNTHESYTARLAYVRGLLEKTKDLEGRKFVIGYDQADRKTLMMYWGLPFETLQISALVSPGSARVIAIAENPDSLANLLSRDSMVSFLMIPPKAFHDWPGAYYRMTDTSYYRTVRLQ
ncbi:MAG TPA: hypothetical protein PK228_03800 [Saprospiraceae bacterium]|nr:hypothetical protein [Saprospiraceae bacterium]